MSRRINIVLPDNTIAVLDRVTKKGNRSRFIDRAVMHLVKVEGQASLRARLKEEAVANAGRDLAIAAEWFPLEEEATRYDATGTGRAKKTTRKRS